MCTHFIHTHSWAWGRRAHMVHLVSQAPASMVAMSLAGFELGPERPARGLAGPALQHCLCPGSFHNSLWAFQLKASEGFSLHSWSQLHLEDSQFTASEWVRQWLSARSWCRAAITVVWSPNSPRAPRGNCVPEAATAPWPAPSRHPAFGPGAFGLVFPRPVHTAACVSASLLLGAESHPTAWMGRVCLSTCQLVENNLSGGFHLLALRMALRRTRGHLYVCRLTFLKTFPKEILYLESSQHF